jgi:hypothetical protein
MTNIQRTTSVRISDAELLKQPLFLVGAERSGSTMLRLMLDHHPDITFEHEFDFVVEQVSDEGMLPAVDSYIDWLMTVRYFSYQVDPSLSYPALVDSFLRQKRLATGSKTYIGATIHHHFDRVLHIWPDARFIHLIRDPRDVARSIVDKGWAGNPYIAARDWMAAEKCWDALAARVQTGQAVDVRYEQLVTEPQAELTRICRFIGVEFDPAMLRYTETAIQYPKPNASLANQWKRKAARWEVEQVEFQVGELMRRRGYEPSYPCVEIGRLKHQFLALESRAKCFRSRVRQLGVGLVLSDMIARRLRLSRLQRRVQLRINAVEAALIELEAAGKVAPSANIQPAAAAQQGVATSRRPVPETSVEAGDGSQSGNERS